MKKVFAIIAILVVLVGAVFAENHQLTVTAAVFGALPKFSLALKSATIANETFDNTKGGWNLGQTNSGLAEYSSGDTLTGSAIVSTRGNQDANALIDDEGIFTLDKAGTIVVVAKVLDNTKGRNTYTLVFGGGNFTGITRNGGTGTITDHVPTNIATEALSDAVYDNTDPENPVLSSASTFTVAGAAGDSDTVTVTFSNATTAANTELVAAVYSYTGDVDIDPGDYTATFTMVVTTV